MRSNAMKTCAVGAMLFGGTLGAASTAQAGLVWLSGDPTYDSYSAGGNLAFGGDSVTWSAPNSSPLAPFTFGAQTLSSGSNSAAFSGTHNFSGGSATGGFSISANFDGNIGGASFSGLLARQGFEVTDGPVEITMTLASGLFYGSGGAGSGIRIASLEGTLAELSNSGSMTFTLGPGRYVVNAGVTAFDPFSGTAVSFSVPAPGAAALLGLAGLIGGRRRN